MNTVFKVALAGACLFCATAARGQDTTMVVDGPMRQIFASPAAVGYMTAPTQDGTLTRAWTWVFLKDAIPSGADTLALEWEIDCAVRTARPAHTALYAGANHMKTDVGPAERAAPPAGSPGAITLEAACATARARTAPVANAGAARTAANALFAAPPPAARR